MSRVNVFVSLDYSQEFVQMCVMDETGKVLANRAVTNCGQALCQAAERYGVVKAAALEACCGSANLADELTALGWSVSLAHPGYVARMKQTIDKTDFADARVLADLLRVGYLPKVWLAPERLRELRRLTRFRQQNGSTSVATPNFASARCCVDAFGEPRTDCFRSSVHPYGDGRSRS